MDLMTTVDTLANHQASHKLDRQIGVSICPFASMIVMHHDAERRPRCCPFVAERDRSGGVVRLDCGRCREQWTAALAGRPWAAWWSPWAVVVPQTGFPARISEAGSAGLPFVQVKAVKPVKGVR